ncbi:unnamed protein product [Rhizoctonia solani]|uniref:Zn(2)-C6 fungal-type domain-containing protein n=1 Tax=Rhizoctonia solani TaxID=456999 RepID=A0A8H3GTC2_9AGAM|nr:unnamed protein product [Rhizoctonia solani]
MAFTRSATGCFACKTKRKKCDETKPYCLRCQKSYIQCPGYTYVQDPNRPGKLRTLPGPRTVFGRSRTISLQGAPVENSQEPHLLQGPSTLGEGSSTFQTSYSRPGTSAIANVGKLPEDAYASNRLAPSSSIGGPHQYSALNCYPSHGLAVHHVNSGPIQTPRGIGVSPPTTSGQADLVVSLLNHDPPVDPDPSLRGVQAMTNPNASYALNWPLPDTQRQDDVTTYSNENPMGATSVIRREPVLDRTTESNALPFVLQGYATWIGRTALDPLKLMDIAREFVFNHFEDGEQSRWIISLIANVGNRIGNVEVLEGQHNPLISALHCAVRRRLRNIKSRPKPTRSELAKALDSALETILIHFYVSPVGEAAIIRQEAASIFRQLCQEPPGASIDLISLLQHPLDCPRRFAQVDITFSVVTDMPTLFRYEVAIPGIRLVNNSQSVVASQGDGIVQWLHGIPNQLVLLFAKMLTMRADGLPSSDEMITAVEQEIINTASFDGSSSDRFLSIMRFVVQECWRQVALVYLYMAVCGDPCDTPRVQGAFKRFMRLLNGTKPGRLPDEFLMLPLTIISPAAQRKREREVIRQRIVGLQTFRRNNNVTYIIEDYWARADDEGRPILWSDVAVSRRQVLGV